MRPSGLTRRPPFVSCRGAVRRFVLTVAVASHSRWSCRCVHAAADSATRKGFWDAVLAGCINVVFNGAGFNETDAWFGDHRQWTLRVPVTALTSPRGVLGHLRAVQRAEVERLHASVLRVRGKIQYALDAGTPGGDGVDVIVQRVTGHFAALRARGQRPKNFAGESACRTIVGHICRQVRGPPRSRE